MMEYKTVNQRDERDGGRDEKRRHGSIREIHAIRGSLSELDHGLHGVHGLAAARLRLISVVPSRTQSHRQSQNMEQKLTKSTKLSSLALTWNQSKSLSLPSRLSVQVLAGSLTAARISRISGRISAGQSSQSHPVKPVAPSPTGRTQSNRSHPVQPVAPSQASRAQSSQSRPVKPVAPSQAGRTQSSQSHPVKPVAPSQASRTQSNDATCLIASH